MALRLLVATHNPGKAREIRALLDRVPVEVVTLKDLGIAEEVPEEGATLEENAVAKAVAYARLSGLWTLADDSGLEVDALGGEPGVHSKRFAPTDPERIARLLERLEGVPWERRTARFRCVVALALPGDAVHRAYGTVEGRIAFRPAGSGGFGYDPIFFLQRLGRTLAQLSPEEKNAVSHRGRAVRAIRALLDTLAREQGV